MNRVSTGELARINQAMAKAGADAAKKRREQEEQRKKYEEERQKAALKQSRIPNSGGSAWEQYRAAKAAGDVKNASEFIQKRDARNAAWNKIGADTLNDDMEALAKSISSTYGTQFDPSKYYSQETINGSSDQVKKMRDRLNALAEYYNTYGGSDDQKKAVGEQIKAYDSELKFLNDLGAHYGQYSSPEAYETLYDNGLYTEKYQGKNYSDIQNALKSTTNDREKAWLEKNADSFMTAAEAQAEIDRIEKAMGTKNIAGQRWTTGFPKIENGKLVYNDNLYDKETGKRLQKLEAIRDSKINKETLEGYGRYLGEANEFATERALFLAKQNNILQHGNETFGVFAPDAKAPYAKNENAQNEASRLSPEKLKAVNEQSGQAFSFLDNADWATDDEKKIYDYLLYYKGGEEAKKYLRALSYELNRRAANALDQTVSDMYDKASGLGKTVLNIGSLGMNIIGNPEAAIDTIAHRIVGERVDPNSNNQTFRRIRNVIREKTGADLAKASEGTIFGKELFGENAANMLYGAAMSSLDSLLGGFTFGEGYTAVMGGGAMADEAERLYNKGASDSQIFNRSFAAGLAEFITEKVSMDNLLKAKSPANGLQVAKEILKQAGIEGSEEMASDVLNLVADSIIMADRSEMSESIQKYKDGYIDDNGTYHKGVSEKEAQKLAWQDFFTDAMADGLAGALSGGMMSAGPTIASYKYSKNRAAIQIPSIDPGNAEGLVSNARINDISVLTDVSEALKNGDAEEAGGVISEGIAWYEFLRKYGEKTYGKNQWSEVRGSIDDSISKLKKIQKLVADGSIDAAAIDEVLKTAETSIKTTPTVDMTSANDEKLFSLLAKGEPSNSVIEKNILKDRGTLAAFERLTGLRISGTTVSQKRADVREAFKAVSSSSETLKAAQSAIESGATATEGHKNAAVIIDQAIQANRAENSRLRNSEKVKSAETKAAIDATNRQHRFLETVRNYVINGGDLSGFTESPVANASGEGGTNSSEAKTTQETAKKRVRADFSAYQDEITATEYNKAVKGSAAEQYTYFSNEEKKLNSDIKNIAESEAMTAEEKAEAIEKKNEEKNRLYALAKSTENVREMMRVKYAGNVDRLVEELQPKLKKYGIKIDVVDNIDTAGKSSSGAYFDRNTNTIKVSRNWDNFNNVVKLVLAGEGLAVTDRASVSFDRAVTQTIAHEIAHADSGLTLDFIKAVAGTQYDAFDLKGRLEHPDDRSWRSEDAQKEKNWRRYVDAYTEQAMLEMKGTEEQRRASAEKVVNDAYIFEEIMADMFGAAVDDMGHSSKAGENIFWAMNRNKPGIIKRILNALERLIARIRGKDAYLAVEQRQAAERLRDMLTGELKRAYGTEVKEKAVSGSAETVERPNGVSKSDRNVQDAAQTIEDGGTIENESGEFVAESDGNGGTRWSLSTYESSGRETLRQYLDGQVSESGLTEADAKAVLDSMDDIYEICRKYEGEYVPFGAWSRAEVVIDEKGNPVFSVIKPNGEYAMNLVFSLVCKKRRALDAVLNRLIETGAINDFGFGQEEIVRVNEIIREHGFEIACDMCFVDAKRYRQAGVADQFVDLYNSIVKSMAKDGQEIDYFNFANDSSLSHTEGGIDRLSDTELDFSKINEITKPGAKKTVEYRVAQYLKTHPSDRKLLSRGDFMSTAGFDAVKVSKPDILKLYNSKKGTGGPKAAQSDVQYLNDILSSKKFNRSAAYDVGGVRVQSFSDYVPRLVFDYVQMIGDLAAKRLPAHAYTKEPLFAKQFGLTGMKINMSLMPAKGNGKYAGLNADGSYAWARESFPVEEAFRIQADPEYGKNVGTIAVGISDEHIWKMLSDPDIRMVIPYHKSGINPAVAVKLKIGEYTDYTGQQNTVRRDGRQLTKAELKNIPDINRLMHRDGLDAVEASRRYVEWCEDNGYIPKFEKFAYMTDSDGSRVFNENYYKLLEDFTTMVDGEFHPQGDVTATFPGSDSAFGSMADLIKEGLEEDAVTANRLNGEVDGLAEEVRSALGREESGKRFSLTRANDEYMKAVESGNVEEQQRLVDEAAENAGYDTVLYHGTQSFGFTQIDVSKYSDDGMSFFATSNPEMAQTYSAKSGTREIGRKSGIENLSLPQVVDRLNAVAAADTSDYDRYTYRIMNRSDTETLKKSVQSGIKELRAETERLISEYADRLAKDFNGEDELKHSRLRSLLNALDSDSASKLSANLYTVLNHNEIFDDAAKVKFGNLEADIRLLKKLAALKTDEDVVVREDTDRYDIVVEDQEKARNRLEKLDNSGNYVLRGRTEGFLEIDGNGHNWNDIFTTLEPKGGNTLKAEYDFDSESLKLSDRDGEFAVIPAKSVADAVSPMARAFARRYGTTFATTVLAQTKDQLKNSATAEVKIKSTGKTNTRDIANFAREQGYPGVKITDIYDNGGRGSEAGRGDVYIFFNPEQDVKSADPITYDNDGNVIPLTERFDSGKSDIRWSLAGTNEDRAEAAEFSDSGIRYSLRKEDPPKKTLTGYKVFVVKNGKLYPPMVANPDAADTPVGVWLNADIGAQAPDSKTGRKQVKAGGKGTQGGSGSLAFRPGWHLGETPLATQFDRTNPETGKRELFPENFVWAECEIAADKNYQEEAMSYGYTKSGKFQHSLAGLPKLPVDGYYKYRTNPNPDTVPWLITGAMKVNRLLDDAEVNRILESKGLPPKNRVGGNKTLADLGLEETAKRLNGDGNIRYSLSANAAEEVKKALADKNYSSEIKLTDTSPTIMLGHDGVKNLPLMMKATHLRENILTEAEAKKLGLPVNEHIHYHGLGDALFLKVISGLDDVKEAYRGTEKSRDSSRGRNYFLLISEQTDTDGNTINIPVFINETAKYNNVFMDVNKVATVFGREQLRKYINSKLADGSLVRIKRRSTQSSEVNADIASHYRKSASSIDNSVSQNDPVVNTQSMQGVEKDSSDERHSLVKSAQSELKALQKENEKLRQDVDDLKQELQLTHGRKLSRDALISSIQKILIDRYGVKLPAKELYPHVTNLYDMFYNNTVDGKRLKKDERVDTMRIIEEMDKIVDAVIENAVGVDDTYVEMKKLLPELRNTKLVVPVDARTDAAQSAGFENWAEFRKANFGRVGFANEGLPVDTYYMELSERYPELFPDGITHPGEQAAHIADVVNTIRESGINEYQLYDIEDERIRTSIKNDVMDIIGNAEKLQTFADRAAQKVEDTKLAEAMHYGADIAKLKRLNAEKVADIKAENRKRLADMRRKYQDRVASVREKYAEDRADRSEKQKQTVLRNKVLRKYTEASSMLDRPTTENHFTEATRKPLMEFLAAVDITTGKSVAKQGVYDRILRVIEAANNATAEDGKNGLDIAETDLNVQEKQLIVDFGLLERMSAWVEANQGKKLTELSSAQLEELNGIFNQLKHLTAEIKRLYDPREGLAAKSWQAQKEIGLAKNRDRKTRLLTGLNTPRKLAEWIHYGSIDAYGFFNTIDSDVMDEQLRTIRRCQDKFGANIAQLSSLMSDAIGKEGIPEGWHGKKAKEITLNLSTGTLRATPSQLMTVHLLLNQEDSRRCLFNKDGGLVIGKFKAKADVQTKENRTKNWRIFRTVSVFNEQSRKLVLNEADADKIIGSLTDAQIACADRISAILNGEAARLGNEVSMAMYGYKKYTTKNYFPMRTVDDYRAIENNPNNEMTLLGLSFTHERTRLAGKALVAEDIFDVVGRHLTNMAQYNAFAQELDNAKKMYALRLGNGTSLKQTLIRQYGDQADKFYRNLINNLSGTEIYASQGVGAFSEKLLSNYKAAAVAKNISVVLKQPMSIFRALSEFSSAGIKAWNSFKDLSPSQVKAEMNEMLEHSGVAKLKNWGASENMTRKSFEELYNNEPKNFLVKINDAMDSGAEFADMWTWSRLWRMSKAEINAQNKYTKGSKEYFEAVNSKFSEVIGKTQVVQSALDSSMAVQNAGTASKFLYAFQNEPLKQYSYLTSAINDAARGKPGAKKKLVKVIASSVANTVAVSAITTLVSLWRGTLDRDDDDELWDDILKSFSENALKDILSGGLAPVWQLAETVWTAIESGAFGKTVERMDLAALTDLGGLINKYLVSQNGGRPNLGMLQDIVNAASNLFGWSAKNVIRDLKAGLDRIIFDSGLVSPMTQYNHLKAWKDVELTNKAAVTEAYYDVLRDAVDRGRYSDYVKIKRDMIYHGYTETKIKNAVMKSSLMDDLYELKKVNPGSYKAKVNSIVSSVSAVSSLEGKEFEDFIESAMKRREREDGGSKTDDEVYDEMHRKMEKEVKEQLIYIDVSKRAAYIKKMLKTYGEYGITEADILKVLRKAGKA